MLGAVPAIDIGPYEGLVLATARKYHERVDAEFEDLAQDLRIKVAKVLPTYDPTRSRLTEEGHVFQCLRNMVKDLMRDAATRKRHAIVEVHIEDYRQKRNGGDPSLDAFEYRYQRLDADEVYGGVEEQEFVMPSTVTEEEAKIARMLAAGYSRIEVAVSLGMTYAVAGERVRSLRSKLKLTLA